MVRLRSSVAAVFIVLAAPAVAKEACPPNKYQPPYPWSISALMNGDEYADVYLDIDKAGKPINCRIGANNIAGDNKFFVCKAFMDQWTTAPPSMNPTIAPPPSNLTTSSPIKGTIHRQYVAYGEQHQKAERTARKQFFQQHPEERPECYRTDD